AIAEARELWCQGYSEPDAGSDLAGVTTRATWDGSHWQLYGQKVWTSLATAADWCFVLARTDPAETGRRGLSYLLVPMNQPGIEVRPITQLTGTSEFNEVFFDGARASAEHVLGQVGDGWRVAMATLGYERGIGTVDQQVAFRRELSAIIERARSNGALDDPVVRDKIARCRTELETMRLLVLRVLSGAEEGGATGPASSVLKLHWATFHRGLGELAMEVAGADGLTL